MNRCNSLLWLFKTNGGMGHTVHPLQSILLQFSSVVVGIGEAVPGAAMPSPSRDIASTVLHR